MMGGRFALTGSVYDMREQFTGLLQGLAPMLPPPSDSVTAGTPIRYLCISSMLGTSIDAWPSV
jgi:hypothetical protein